VKLVDTYEEKANPFQRAVFSAPTVPAAEAPQKRLNALALELDKGILDFLSDTQRAQWHSMLGKQFDWEKIRLADASVGREPVSAQKPGEEPPERSGALIGRHVAFPALRQRVRRPRWTLSSLAWSPMMG
jgi:hypothetical protein